jgi:hypothetical protein
LQQFRFPLDSLVDPDQPLSSSDYASLLQIAKIRGATVIAAASDENKLQGFSICLLFSLSMKHFFRSGQSTWGRLFD